MKFIFLFILIFAFSYNGICQIDSIIQKRDSYNLTLDTLKIQSLDNSKKDFWDSPNGPWFISGILSLISLIVTLFGNFLLRSTSIKTLDKQIENTSTQATLQHGRTLNAENKQIWITDVRKSLSILISNAELLNLELQLSSPDKTRVNNFYEIFETNEKLMKLLITDIKADGQVDNIVVDFLQKLSALKLNCHSKYSAFIKSNTQPNIPDFQSDLDEVLIKGRDIVYKVWWQIEADNKKN